MRSWEVTALAYVREDEETVIASRTRDNAECAPETPPDGRTTASCAELVPRMFQLHEQRPREDCETRDQIL